MNQKKVNEVKLLPTKGCPGCAMLINAITKLRKAQTRTLNTDARDNAKWNNSYAAEKRAETELDRVIGGIQFLEEIRN